MNLGAFSVSLAVNDLRVSKKFYEKLGFLVFAGSEEENWLILRNESCVIGLFQGMFERNILTFNPGWDQHANQLDNFPDVRQLQRMLKERGIEIHEPIDEKTGGPASFMITDPDGNPILLDQHV